MKFKVFSLLILASTSFAQAQDHPDKLVETEKLRSEAISSHNDDFLINLYDDTFRGVTAAGEVVDKHRQLELFKSNHHMIVFETAELASSKVDENTVIVTGKLVSKSRNGAMIGQSRFLHVYSKHNNQWKIIRAQDTIVIKE